MQNSNRLFTRTIGTPVLLLLGACAAVPPVLNAALVAFGQDLIQTATQNFTPQYAQSASGVLLALAETATGQPFTQQADGQLTAVDTGFDDGFEPDTADDATYTEEPVASDDNEGFDEGFNEPTDPDPVFHDGDTPVPTSSPEFSDTSATLEVALFKQTPDGADGFTLNPIEDGARLVSNADPRLGDKLKFFYRSNCACFLYVIGVDSTGWLTRIYPRTDDPNPIPADEEGLIPSGAQWWGLDEYKGVETIYFVLSKTALSDLETQLQSLPAARPALPAVSRTVSEAPLIPTRGLVLVEETAPAHVASEAGTVHTLDTLGFTNNVDPNRVVVSRWFHHD